MTEETTHKIQEQQLADALSERYLAYALSTIVARSLPDVRDGLLSISYRGDVARLYANGKLIDDNFYNGRPFLYGLWRLPADCRQLELKILPLQEKMPVYFPKEADTTPGEMVGEVKVIRQVANP